MFRVAHGSANWVTVPLGLALLMAGLATPIGYPWLFSLSFVPFFLFLAFWFFFRDPERAVAGGVVSPADGKITGLGPVDDPDLGRAERLSVFMRVTDVHVNRFPLAGDVRSVEHTAGKHVPAFSKDSDRNERVTLRMRTDLGDVKVVQIAGAVARRIVPYAAAGDHVERGERLGLIRLGSRCDLIVPAGSVEWTVRVGDRVRASLSRVAKRRVAGSREASGGDLATGADAAEGDAATGAYAAEGDAATGTHAAEGDAATGARAAKPDGAVRPPAVDGDAHTSARGTQDPATDEAAPTTDDGEVHDGRR